MTEPDVLAAARRVVKAYDKSDQCDAGVGELRDSIDALDNALRVVDPEWRDHIAGHDPELRRLVEKQARSELVAERLLAEGSAD